MIVYSFLAKCHQASRWTLVTKWKSCARLLLWVHTDVHVATDKLFCAAKYYSATTSTGAIQYFLARFFNKDFRLCGFQSQWNLILNLTWWWKQTREIQNLVNILKLPHSISRMCAQLDSIFLWFVLYFILNSKGSLLPTDIEFYQEILVFHWKTMFSFATRAQTL